MALLTAVGIAPLRPLALDVAQCPTVDVDKLERIVTSELQRWAQDHAVNERFVATVQCEAGEASLQVADSEGGENFVGRRLKLPTTKEPTRERVLAIALAELVRSLWRDQQWRREAEAAPVPAQPPSPPAPLPTSAPGPQAVTSARVSLGASGRVFAIKPNRHYVGLRAGFAVDPVPGFAVEGDIDGMFGRFQVEEGGVSINSASCAMVAGLRTPLQLLALRGSTFAGLGVRGGYAVFEGKAPTVEAVPKRHAATFAWPLVRLGLQVGIGRGFSAGVGVDAGYVTRRIDASVGSRRVAVFGGGVLDASLLVAKEL